MKVLIVDDEPLIRRSLEKAFQNQGHEVRLAADGTEGLEVWRAWSPAIAVVDILMPGLTGPELIAATGPHQETLVALISAFSGDYDAQAIRELGADLFIEKPFEDIQNVVVQLLHAQEQKKQ